MSKTIDIHEMYKTIDTFDADGLVAYMHDDATFKFANMDPVIGKENIKNFLNGFYSSIKAIKHTNIEDWKVDGVRFAIGDVTYTRHDDSQLKVPFSVALKTNDKLIKDYLIYVDTSQLYQ